MANRKDGPVFNADHSGDASERLHLLRAANGAAKHVRRIRCHQVADTTLAVELSLSVRQQQRQNGLVDAALLRTFVCMVRNGRAMVTTRREYLVAVAQDYFPSFGETDRSTLRKIVKRTLV